MYVYQPAPAEDYFRYYKNQAGFGQPHPGISTFRGARYQRGNGLGSIFSSLVRAITPLFKSSIVRNAGRKLGTAALSSGLNLGSDLLEGKNFGQSLKRRAAETGADLFESAAGDLRSYTGSGRKRRKKSTVAKAGRRKKRTTRKATKSKKRRAPKKRKAPKRRGKKRKPGPKRKRSKRSSVRATIFDN